MPAERHLDCQRSFFSLPRGVHYLNCAYMAPRSDRVRAAGREGIEREGRPDEIVAEDFFRDCDRVKDLFAQVVGLDDSARVALIPSVSYGLATVVRNTPLARGQNVVTLHEHFPSNVHTWRRLCREVGAELRMVAPPTVGPGSGEAWNDAILEAIDGETAAVSVGSVHWTDGTRFDLDRIGARAREVGAAFVVDGTQSVGAAPFDIATAQPDALVCAGYKWLTGPYSLGVAYYGPRYDDGVPLEETWSGRAGAQDFARLVDQADAYREGAARYDVGEPGSFVLVPMLVAALEQLLAWGVTEVAAYVAALTDSLLEDPRAEMLGLAAARPDSTHVFALPLPEGTDPGLVAARLRESAVHVSVRGTLVRVSPHVYNDASDIAALVEALAGALREA